MKVAGGIVVVGFAGIVALPASALAAPRTADPCADISAAYANLEADIRFVFEKLRHELPDALVQIDAELATETPGIDAAILAAEAAIVIHRKAHEDFLWVCLKVDMTPCLQVPMTPFAVPLAEATAERDRLVAERSRMQQLRLIRAAMAKQIAIDDVALVAARDKAIQSLAEQQAKALADCAKRVAAWQLTADATVRLCGPGTANPTTSTVVLAGTTAPATRGMALVGQTLGAPQRATAKILLATDPRAALQATTDALTASAGKLLVIDGASLLSRASKSRVERATRAVFAATLRLEPRIVVVRVNAAIGPADQALAAANGWRIAANTDDGIRAALCSR